MCLCMSLSFFLSILAASQFCLFSFIVKSSSPVIINTSILTLLCTFIPSIVLLLFLSFYLSFFFFPSFLPIFFLLSFSSLLPSFIPCILPSFLPYSQNPPTLTFYPPLTIPQCLRPGSAPEDEATTSDDLSKMVAGLNARYAREGGTRYLLLII